MKGSKITRKKRTKKKDLSSKHSKSKSKGKSKSKSKSKKSTVRKLADITSITILQDKSPQVLKKNESSVLNRYTTKNVSLLNKKGQSWNAVLNNKLIYKRPPRNHDLQINTRTVFGPMVERITKNNYKKLKIKDVIYPTEYQFTILVRNLEKEKLYRILKR